MESGMDLDWCGVSSNAGVALHLCGEEVTVSIDAPTLTCGHDTSG